MNLKSHRQYVNEETAKSPELAQEYEKATSEARFAVALAMLREKRGLTQQQVAEKAGIAQPMLARYERGQLPTVSTLQRLAAALNARVTLLPDEIRIEPVVPRRLKPKSLEKIA